MKKLTTIYCENNSSVVQNVLKVFILMNKAHGWRATNREAALSLKKKKASEHLLHLLLLRLKFL